jgi:hypothetical protein
MTGSDNVTRGPDRKMASAGPGMAPTFRCAACARPGLSTTGRRLRRVHGVRQWVCAKCAEVRA